MTRAVVIGIGNPYRGDDAVGHAAGAALMDLLPNTQVLLQDGEPLRLVESWTGRALAVVVDAVRTGSEPGTVHRIEVGVDPIPAAMASHSTHGAGIEAAVELSRELDRCPEKLVIYGVEPAAITEGPGLSPAVVMALPDLVKQVVREVQARRP